MPLDVFTKEDFDYLILTNPHVRKAYMELMRSYVYNMRLEMEIESEMIKQINSWEDANKTTD